MMGVTLSLMHLRSGKACKVIGDVRLPRAARKVTSAGTST
jgi:hypothetical protein